MNKVDNFLHIRYIHACMGAHAVAMFSVPPTNKKPRRKPAGR